MSQRSRCCESTGRICSTSARACTASGPIAAFAHELGIRNAVGTPITGVQVGIMGPGGELLPTGEQGEIVYRGRQALNGYLKNPEATARA